MKTLCATSVFSVFSVVRKTFRSFLSTEVRKFVHPVKASTHEQVRALRPPPQFHLDGIAADATGEIEVR